MAAPSKSSLEKTSTNWDPLGNPAKDEKVELR